MDQIQTAVLQGGGGKNALHQLFSDADVGMQNQEQHW